MSFGRRLELATQIRDLGRELEFLQAGNDPNEKMSAAVLSRRIDEIYLRWGLVAVDGMEIDGGVATPARVILEGPEELAREALEAIRAQCGLSEEERKN
jgi:hypothetical protein